MTILSIHLVLFVCLLMGSEILWSCLSLREMASVCTPVSVSLTAFLFTVILMTEGWWLPNADQQYLDVVPLSNGVIGFRKYRASF
ncbi:hypothetical protein EDD17DRAFT_173065 [Pisolithus thermaeus]|nr:hypothetical protein EDD17DRAFT_173065 [Pisolithus thermaeus]